MPKAPRLPSDRQVTLRLPGELYSRLEKVAQEEDRSVGYVMRVLLRDALWTRDHGGVGDPRPFVDRPD